MLANLDGLCDYDEDFTDAATVITGMKTAFDAVRGYAPPPDEEHEEEPAEGEEPAESTVAASDESGAAETNEADQGNENASGSAGKDGISEDSSQV